MFQRMASFRSAAILTPSTALTATPEQLETFERWGLATSDSLYRLAARVVGDLDAAADVLQDAYLRAFAALRRNEFSGDSEVRTWLYRIVLNVALNARRSDRRRLAQLASLEGEAEAGDRIEARLQLRELASWMADLPDEQCAALVLKELEGFSSREVGEILECSEGAVEQRLVRARAALRKRSSDE
jgi:RNA polymerase sigma-70 factor (ECF subfamily)